MSEQYQPPEMPPFPVDYDGLMKAVAPYHQNERPLDFFLEMYVCSVIEELPQETKNALHDFSLKYPALFATYDGDWQAYVRGEYHLSSTIDIAILDLWIRNSQIAKRDGWVFHPWHFAQCFLDNYFADGSQVDVWEGDALEAAKQRIADYKRGSQQ